MSTTCDLTLWMNTTGKYPVLSKEEQLALAQRIYKSKEGSKQRIRLINKMACHNLKLVTSIVTSTLRRNTRNGFTGSDRVDYMHVGVLGLIHAIEKYDPTRGYAFSTYAVNWIKAYVMRYYARAHTTIHIPENAQRDWYNFYKTGIMPPKKSGVERTPEEQRFLAHRINCARSPFSLDLNLDETSSSHNAGGIRNSMSHVINVESKNEWFQPVDQFEDDYEDWIERAELTDKEVEVIRQVNLYGRKPREVCNLMDIHMGQFNRLKLSAYEKMKSCKPAHI